MIFQDVLGEGTYMECCPARRPRLPGVHCRSRRNALWLHATTKGLFDPVQNRIRPYTVVELAEIWGLTPNAVRSGVKEAIKDREFVERYASAQS